MSINNIVYQITGNQKYLYMTLKEIHDSIDEYNLYRILLNGNADMLLYLKWSRLSVSQILYILEYNPNFLGHLLCSGEVDLIKWSQLGYHSGIAQFPKLYKYIPWDYWSISQCSDVLRRAIDISQMIKYLPRHTKLAIDYFTDSQIQNYPRLIEQSLLPQQKFYFPKEHIENVWRMKIK